MTIKSSHRSKVSHVEARLLLVVVETAGEDSLSASEGRIRLRTEDALNAGPPPPPQLQPSIQRRRWYVSGGSASNPKSSFNKSFGPLEAPLTL